MLWGRYPQQNEGVSSPTETQKIAWPRALGLGEKFYSQEKAADSTPLRSPGLSHQGPSLLSFSFASYHAHTPILGRTNPEHCYPDDARCFLVCMINHSWFLFASFIFAIQILWKTLKQSWSKDPKETPQLCAAPDFEQRDCKYMCRSQRYWPLSLIFF